MLGLLNAWPRRRSFLLNSRQSPFAPAPTTRSFPGGDSPALVTPYAEIQSPPKPLPDRKFPTYCGRSPALEAGSRSMMTRGFDVSSHPWIDPLNASSGT